MAEVVSVPDSDINTFVVTPPGSTDDSEKFREVARDEHIPQVRDLSRVQVSILLGTRQWKKIFSFIFLF